MSRAPSKSSRPEVPAADAAYLGLRDLIVRGVLPPGARVAEAELARRLGISRTPVRDAIGRLLSAGLLNPDGGGARPRLAVAPLRMEDVDELYRVAGALEGVHARRAAALPDRERATLVVALERREQIFRGAARRRPLDYDELFRQHSAVHSTLVDATAAAHARALLEAIRPRLDRYEYLYAPLVGPDFAATFEEHAEMIQAVRAGNAGACERAVRMNYVNSGRRFGRAIREAGHRAPGLTATWAGRAVARVGT